MAAQTGYTIALHTRALRAQWSGRGADSSYALIVAVALAIVLGVFGYSGGSAIGLAYGELFYRLFMLFYGLVFPAYAWLCMLPTWRNPQKPGRRQLTVFTAAVLLAAPFYYLAFIAGRMGWVSAGVAVVLVARLALGRSSNPSLLA
jgi:hypothetical protein